MRYRLAEFELDTQRELLIGPAGVVGLRPQAFRLLRHLVERTPALVSRDELMDALWGHHALSPNVIPQTVSELRQALGDDPQQPRFIETRHRRGYAFIAAVETLPDAAPLAPAAAETSPPPAAAVSPVPIAASIPERSWPQGRWLALAFLSLLVLGWVSLRPARVPEAAIAPVAATRFALRLDSAPPALAAYLGVLARSSGDWVLQAPATASGSAWTLSVELDGRWRLRDAQGQERSSGVLPQADLPSQAQALLRALEAPAGRSGLARDPSGWPAELEARQALVAAALAVSEGRDGDALTAHARAAPTSAAPGWPTLLHAEALARGGDWSAASERLDSLHGAQDRALALQVEVLRARLRGRPAELLAAQTAYTLLVPEDIDARLDVLDLQLAQAQWPAAADSLEALGAELGEDSAALAWRRAQWLGAMQPGQAPQAFDWAIQRAREAADRATLRHAQLALAEWQLRRSQLAAAGAAIDGLATDDPQALDLRAQIAIERGELAVARARLDAADAIWRARGRHGESRRTRLGMVEVALRAGEHADAAARAAALIAEAGRQGDTRLDGELLQALGRAQTGLGQLEPAREHLQRAIDVARELGDVKREASARYHMGNLHAHERRLHEAEQAYRLAAEAYRSLRDARGESLALANLALMAERAGRRQDARDAYSEALAGLQELAIPREIGRVTFNLGVSERDLGELAQASRHFDAAAVALDDAGAADIRLLVGAARADVALLQGDSKTAGDALAAVANLRDQAAWLPQTAWLTATARRSELAGGLDDAREALRRALAVRQRAAVRVAVLDVELRLLRLDLAAGTSVIQARLAVEAIEAELLRLGEPGYALGASLAAVEAAWMSGDIQAAHTRVQELRIPVQSRGTRAQQLHLEWLQALTGEDSLRGGRLHALAQAADTDGFYLLARVARRESLPEGSSGRAASDQELTRDGLGGAVRSPVAVF